MLPSTSQDDPITNAPIAIPPPPPPPPPNSDLQQQQHPIPQFPQLPAVQANQACAACKHQRRRCLPDCQLAEYFPADKTETFLNVHRLFGVGNTLKTLKKTHPLYHNDAMGALIYEADVRSRCPIHGCYGIVAELAKWVRRLQDEISLIKKQIEEAKVLVAMQCGISDDVLNDRNCGGSRDGIWGHQQTMGVYDCCDPNNGVMEGGHVMVGPSMEESMMIEPRTGLMVERGFDQSIMANIGNNGDLYDMLPQPLPCIESDPMEAINPRM